MSILRFETETEMRAVTDAHYWHDIGTEFPWVALTGEDKPTEIQLPIKVSRRQLFLALYQFGLYDAVMTWRNTQATQEQSLEFDTAGEFDSSYPLLISAAQQLGMTDDQRLNIFRLAQTL